MHISLSEWQARLPLPSTDLWPQGVWDIEAMAREKSVREKVLETIKAPTLTGLKIVPGTFSLAGKRRLSPSCR